MSVRGDDVLAGICKRPLEQSVRVARRAHELRNTPRVPHRTRAVWALKEKKSRRSIAVFILFLGGSGIKALKALAMVVRFKNLVA